MPRQAPYLLQWSLQAQAYVISGGDISVPREITSESFAWFDGISSFAFRGRSGAHCTARKEIIQRGSYWYAYRSVNGRTVKRYLGRTADLSLARLEEVAERFTGAPLAHHTRPARPVSALPSSPLPVSRLHPPRLPLALVERPDLFARLDAWCSHKLTLLLAPAGFGKTTLVNSWQAERRSQRAAAHIAWITLESSDNDPVHFWRSVIEACQAWQSEIGKTALAQLLSTLQPPFVPVSLHATLTLFLNDLANRVRDGILILDDYHVIVEPRLHEAVAFFIEYLPPQIHVMILTRSEPPLPLVRWRAQGDMQELHTADLRFSTQETATFLQQTTASLFSEKTIDRLDTVLEGWPAGLRLLGLSGRMTQDQMEHHLSALGEQQRSTPLRRQLLDYFISEVFKSQPEPLQRFLLQTSVLSRLTGSLCDAVTGRQDSSVLLETLEQAGIFLEALDETGEWYRYHTLFADAMRDEARRCLGRETLRALSLQASLWYEQHALSAEAIEAALQAHDVERAGLLIEQYGASGQSYELHTLRRWLQHIPDAVLYAHPVLCLYSAITLQILQEEIPLPEMRARIEELLQKAEDGWRRQEKLPWIGLVYAFRALIASLHGIDVQGAVENAKKALALLPKENRDGRGETRPGIVDWHTMCLGIVGSAEIHQGHFDEARQHLLEALVYSQISHNKAFMRGIMLRLGAACASLGELHQANEYYRQALSAAREQEDGEDTTQALLGLARLSFAWNDLAAAEQQVNEAFELANHGGQESGERAAYLFAHLLFARGQDIAAQQQLAVLLARLQALSTPNAQELLPDALALQTRLQLAAGDLVRAQRSLALLTEVIQATGNAGPSFVQQMTTRILQARLQLTQGQAREVVSLLGRVLAAVQEKRYMRGELEIKVLLALAYAACGQKHEACQWLQQALSQACDAGILDVFLSEKEALARLLRSLLPTIREKAPRSYGRIVLRAFTIPEKALSLSSSSPSFAALPLEQLSMQEQRVLQLLVAGHTNPEIASELVISVNTVKDHVKHIYRKLNVSNRLEARDAARRLQRP